MLKNWKTSSAAMIYALVEGLHAVPNLQTMTLGEMGVKAAQILAVAAIGLMAADHKEEPKP